MEVACRDCDVGPAGDRIRPADMARKLISAAGGVDIIDGPFAADVQREFERFCRHGLLAIDEAALAPVHAHDMIFECGGGAFVFDADGHGVCVQALHDEVEPGFLVRCRAGFGDVIVEPGIADFQRGGFDCAVLCADGRCGCACQQCQGDDLQGFHDDARPVIWVGMYAKRVRAQGASGGRLRASGGQGPLPLHPVTVCVGVSVRPDIPPLRRETMPLRGGAAARRSRR